MGIHANNKKKSQYGITLSSNVKEGKNNKKEGSGSTSNLEVYQMTI